MIRADLESGARRRQSFCPVNRFEVGGPEESVHRLYLLLHGRSSREVAC
ncbi:hypothetical protein ACFWZR_20420 [Streptomyces sp. NPDC059017]